MKLVLVTYYIGLHDEVMDLLTKLGVSCYTRWREVEGKCSCGEPHDGTQVWPGMNSALMAVVEDSVARSLMSEIEIFNRKREGERIDACVIDVAGATRASG